MRARRCGRARVFFLRSLCSGVEGALPTHDALDHHGRDAREQSRGLGSAGSFSKRSARTLAIMRRRREGTNWPRSLSIRRWSGGRQSQQHHGHAKLLSTASAPVRLGVRDHPTRSLCAESPAYPGAAAQTRMVSMAGIRLDSRKSVRSFKGIICVDISEFESYMPSHAVRSRCAISAADRADTTGCFRQMPL